MAMTWNLDDARRRAQSTQVFSGGACNIINEAGELLRNPGRDGINAWLHDKDINYYDPQIHPDTHGTEYHYETHHAIEVSARAAAGVDLYEVSPLSFGGITSFEIAADHLQNREPVVIYYSDEDAQYDKIPVHSEEGYPLFCPAGLHKSEAAMRAHYREFIKNANNMRKYVMHFARTLDTLTVTFSGTPQETDVQITPERIHAADMFEAVMRASHGERVIINFPDDATKRDERGNPLFIAPQNPPRVELEALLDQYVDAGNALRKAIARLVEISVFVRVVYTERSAIVALEELLKVTGHLPRHADE
jgi:hypothetical protein